IERASEQGALARALERHLDEDLRLGPRHEHAAIDDEAPSIELALAPNVRDGLAAPAAQDHLAKAPELVGAERSVRVDHETHAIDAEHVSEQELGFEPRTREAAASEILRRPAQHAADGPGL